MNGEGRRPGSLLCNRKVVSVDCAGLACAARREARNSWAQKTARRPGRSFIGRSYSRRRWARRPTADNQLVKRARLTQLALGASASKVVRDRSLQAPRQNGPRKEESRTCTDDSGIPFFQPFALKRV